MQVAGANSLALSIVFVALLLCAAGQTALGYLRIMHSTSQTRRLAAVYESALLVHLVLMAAFALGCAGAWADERIHFVYLGIPLDPALWANAVTALVAAYAAVVGIEEDDVPAGAESPGWMPAVDAIVMALCTPLLRDLLGGTWTLVLFADAAYFLFRTVFLLFIGKRLRRRMVSSLSIAEAMRRLPEGILYADKHGHTLVANDAMRHCLSALGLSTDFGKVGDLWKELNARADADPDARVVQSVEREPGDWVIARIGADEARLFSFEGAGFAQDRRYSDARPLEIDSTLQGESKRLLGAEAFMRVIAYDVTREVEILQEIDRTNAELAASQRELQASMRTVQEAAENDAMLRMRGRVHDVIGQRLSMLHRALEDDEVSDEKLEQLKPLLNGILDDLAADTRVEPADELAATVDAFALTGVNVRVSGALPSDAARAKLFVDCIREGATNAVKHAHATEVLVTCAESELVIANAGGAAAEPLVEGTGLANMRRAVEAAGLALSITPAPTFTLRITPN